MACIKVYEEYHGSNNKFNFPFMRYWVREWRGKFDVFYDNSLTLDPPHIASTNTLEEAKQAIKNHWSNHEKKLPKTT